MCVDMCIDMCIDMCVGMFVDMFVDMCADICAGMCYTELRLYTASIALLTFEGLSVTSQVSVAAEDCHNLCFYLERIFWRYAACPHQTELCLCKV